MTGNVEFGDLFEDEGGLTKANAVVPQATVVPRYSAQLKLVLDLRQPVTGTACDPDCPFEQTNIDGTSVLVTEQPLPAERFMIGTGYDLATASLPISTAVDVNAGVGFVKVHLGGTLKVCAVTDAAGCTGDPKDAGDMLKVSSWTSARSPCPRRSGGFGTTPQTPTTARAISYPSLGAPRSRPRSPRPSRVPPACRA